MKKITSLLLSLIMLVTSIGVGFYAYAMDISYGVDVSEFNEGVDYAKNVQGKGKSFVMIRLGYYNHLDKYFWQNVKAACDAGLDYGVYLYSYAYSVDEAIIEADFVIDTLSQLGDYAEHFTLPVAYDMEDNQLKGFGKAQLTNQMTAFCDKIQKAGYVPMIYSNLDWFTNYINLNTAVSKGYKIWYAYWTNSSPDTTKQIEIGNTGVKPDMWQYKGVDYASPTVFDENLIYYTSQLVQPLKCYHCYVTVTDKAATADANGSIVKKCKNCGNVLEQTAIPKASNIKLSRTTITYTGTVQRPTVTVTDSAGNALTYKKDFTVSYSNINSTNVGTYSVTVNFMGNYSGSKTYTYKIVPQTNVTPKLNRNTITYTGTVQRPTVTVTDVYGNQLVYNKDFKVSYSNFNSKEVGRYTVTVTMIGNYSGSKTYAYYINPKGTTISGITAKSKGFTVKWNKQTNQTTGYQIQYATKSDFSNAATIYAGPSSATSKTVTGRAGNTRYYVRIRTYKNIGGKYFYSSWSSAKSIVTLK